MTQEESGFLIYKRLREGLTPTESKALDAWLAQSAENRRMAAEIKAIWDSVGVQDFPDTDAELASLKRRLEDEQLWPSKAQQVTFSASKWWRWVIFVLLMLGIVAVWVLREPAQPPVEPVAWQKIAARDDRTQPFVLPDGTKVWLNQGAWLEHPQTFEGLERKTRLVGEAFFEVVEVSSQPFIVESGGCEVKVVGTSFNIRTRASKDTEVSVKSGQVQVKSPDLVIVNLKPGESVVFDSLARRLKPIEPLNLAAVEWHTGTITFKEFPLQLACAYFSRLFDQDFILDDPEMADCPYTCYFPANDNLNQILTNLKSVFYLKVVPSNNGNRLVGGTCK